MTFDRTKLPMGLQISLEGAEDFRRECSELGVLCEIVCSVRDRDEPGANPNLPKDALTFFIVSNEGDHPGRAVARMFRALRTFCDGHKIDLEAALTVELMLLRELKGAASEVAKAG